MSGLAGILSGRRSEGVYRWDSNVPVSALAESIDVAGRRLAYLDGWTVGDTRADVLASMGSALEFADHYGRNLDALVDCLRDVGADGRATVLLWDGWAVFARADERSFALVVRILGERSEDGSRPGFTVLLRGEGPELESIPELD